MITPDSVTSIFCTSFLMIAAIASGRSSLRITCFRESVNASKLSTQMGSSCVGMLRYPKSKADAAFDHSYKIIKNIESNDALVDAIMINDGKNITTLLLEKNPAVEEQMIQIVKFRNERHGKISFGIQQ